MLYLSKYTHLLIGYVLNWNIELSFERSLNSYFSRFLKLFNVLNIFPILFSISSSDTNDSICSYK